MVQVSDTSHMKENVWGFKVRWLTKAVVIFLGLKEEESFTPSSNIEPIEDKDYNT